MADEKTYTQEELDAQLNSLKTKNSDLIGDIKELKKVTKQFEGIDLESLKNASTELEKLKTTAKEKDGEYKDLYETTIKNATTERDTLQAEIDGLKSKITTGDIKRSIAKELGAIEVIPKLLDSATKLVNTDSKLIDGNVFIGDKPVGDFIKDWAKSDVGKHFIGNGNSGGDSFGSNNSGSSVEAGYFKKDSPTYNKTEQAKLANKDPKRYEELTKKYS